VCTEVNGFWRRGRVSIETVAVGGHSRLQLPFAFGPLAPCFPWPAKEQKPCSTLLAITDLRNLGIRFSF
jgi:hypothetical protein